MRVIRLFSLSCALAAVALVSSEAQTPEPTILQIMLGLTVPASGAILDVKEPEFDKDLYWQRVEASAVMLAESGKMLRQPAIARDDGLWMAHAQRLVDTARKAAEAARTRDADAVFQAGVEVYKTCDDCHARYLTGGE